MNRFVLATMCLLAVGVISALTSEDVQANSTAGCSSAYAAAGCSGEAYASHGHRGPVRGLFARGVERRQARRAARQEARAARHASYGCSAPASYSSCAQPAVSSCAAPPAAPMSCPEGCDCESCPTEPKPPAPALQ